MTFYEESFLSDPQERKRLEGKIIGEHLVETRHSIEMFTSEKNDEEMGALVVNLLDEYVNPHRKIVHIRTRSFLNFLASKHLVLYPDRKEGIYKAVVGVEGNKFKLAIPYMTPSSKMICFVEEGNSKEDNRHYYKKNRNLYVRCFGKSPTYLGALFLTGKENKERTLLDEKSRLQSKAVCTFLDERPTELYPGVKKQKEEEVRSGEKNAYAYSCNHELDSIMPLDAKTHREEIFRTKVDSSIELMIIKFFNGLSDFLQKNIPCLMDKLEFGKERKLGVRFAGASALFFIASFLTLIFVFHSAIFAIMFGIVGACFQSALVSYIGTDYFFPSDFHVVLITKNEYDVD